MSIHRVDAFPTFESSEIAIDIETTVYAKKTSKSGDADPYTDRILSIQASDGVDTWILTDNYMSAIPLLVNPNIRKIGQGLIFDCTFLKRHLGVDTVNIHDTLLCERILRTGLDTGGNDLGSILARRLDIYVDKSKVESFYLHEGDFTYEQLTYMANDVLYLRKIREQQLQEISNLGMGKILALENTLLPVLVDMQLQGVNFNRDLWASHTHWMETELEKIKERVCSYLGLSYTPSLFGGMEIGMNLNSTDQVKSMLSKLDCPVTSTGEGTLQIYLEKEDTPELARKFIADILLWRGWEKLLTSNYPSYVNRITGRIHTKWNQIQADTGRFSSSNPNLQNIRKPTKGEPNFRHLFPPDEGCSYIVADYSQQEVRVMASISGDAKLIKACEDGDVYSAMASIAYNKPVKKGDPERDIVKTVVLADAYGQGAGSTAYKLGISIEAARKFKNEIHSTFSDMNKFFVGQGNFVVQRGYVKTLMGRRRWIKEAIGADKEHVHRYIRQAQNMPIQGSAADITKIAMLKVHDYLKQYEDSRKHIVFQVHDELVVQAPNDDAEEVLYNVVGAMEQAMLDVCPDVKPGVDAKVLPLWDKV